MNNKLMDCIANPVMCKLFLDIYQKETVTAKQLTEAYPDIAQTTLYRYLKRMTDDGIIKVVQEKPVRGTVEKIYSRAVNLEENINDIVKNNDGSAYALLFTQYMHSFVKIFQEYGKRENLDISKDISTFTSAPVFVTDSELKSALIKIGEIITGLIENKPSKERRSRSIGVIITPPADN